MSPSSWPPFGCFCYAFRHKETREHGISPAAEKAVFLGWDESITNGTIVGLLPEGFEFLEVPVSEVVTATTVKCHEEEFPLVRWSRLQGLKDPAKVSGNESRCLMRGAEYVWRNA